MAILKRRFVKVLKNYIVTVCAVMAACSTVISKRIPRKAVSYLPEPSILKTSYRFNVKNNKVNGPRFCRSWSKMISRSLLGRMFDDCRNYINARVHETKVAN